MLRFSNENLHCYFVRKLEGKSNYSWFGCFNKHKETKYKSKVFDVSNPFKR